MLSINICRVNTPEGEKDYVSCLPVEVVMERGLVPEAILGVLTRPLNDAESITPEIFLRNRAFIDFLHNVIARRAPALSELHAEAKRQNQGSICILDLRTPTPKASVPPEDIIGAFVVKNGEIVPDSYHPNPKHQILTANGFVRLDSALEACLLEELNQRNGKI